MMKHKLNIAVKAWVTGTYALAIDFRCIFSRHTAILHMDR